MLVFTLYTITVILAIIILRDCYYSHNIYMRLVLTVAIICKNNCGNILAQVSCGQKTPS